MSLDRRRFLAGAAGAAALAALYDPWSALPAAARERALRRTLATTVRPDGTTLVSAPTPTGAGPYFRLADGPGWPLLVRSELATPKSGREDRRTPLLSFVQFTDVHLVDTESPTRVEFLDTVLGSFVGSAWRPHETLSTHVSSSLVDQVRTIGAGPFSGRKFDFLISTGDNVDNTEHVELDWFLTILNGGHITPTTGNLSAYEGVQAWGDPQYWNPEAAVSDEYKGTHGYPAVPGMIAAAITPFDTTGVGIPWYSTFGNHDTLTQGTVPKEPFELVYTGSIKVTGLAGGLNPADFLNNFTTRPAAITAAILGGGGAPFRTVTPDPRRAPFTPAQYAAIHLDPANTGPGPVGHGYTAANLDGGPLDYTFSPLPGILGISLDTNNRGGYSDGSLGTAQLAWLEAQLVAASGRYFDTGGNEVRTGNADQLIMIFSHHTSTTMGNPIPDPARPTEARHTGKELVALLHRFPNVVAWVNGHTHENHVTPQPDTSGKTGGFWEINTAAHIDYPEEGRVIEMVDNGDGTLSIFATIFQAAAPTAVNYSNLSRTGLASLSRELSFNDPQADPLRIGPPESHNVELLLTRPHTPSPAAPPASTPGAAVNPTGAGHPQTGTLAYTGSSVGVPLAVAGAAATAAGGLLALRRRAGAFSATATAVAAPVGDGASEIVAGADDRVGQSPDT